MKSYERVMLALNHKEADKIPIDCGAMRSTGITAKMYSDYRSYKGINSGGVKVYDMVQQLAIPEDWFLEMHRIDTIDLSRAFADDETKWHEFSLQDGTTVLNPKWVSVQKQDGSFYIQNGNGEKIAEMPQGSFFYDQKIWPYLGDDTDDFSSLPQKMHQIMWCDVADPMWQYASDKNFYNLIRQRARQLRENTDSAIVAGFGGQLFELGCYLYRNDEFMINLLIERKRTEKLLDQLTEMHMENLKKFVDAVKGYVDVIVMGDDLGTQSGPMIDPQLYRDVILPRAKKIYRIIKDQSDIKIFLHSCGAVFDFIPDFIDAGVDILNPVQTTARGMDAARLKEEFGRDIVFWGGGVDTQKSMLFNSPDQIKEEVKRNCEIFMKDGGFVFNQIHNMLPGIPPQNIDAMFEAVNGISY